LSITVEQSSIVSNYVSQKPGWWTNQLYQLYNKIYEGWSTTNYKTY